MTGRHGPPHTRRRGHALLASGIGLLGLSILVVPLSGITLASSGTGAPSAPHASATPKGSLPDGGSHVPGVRIVRAAAAESGHPYKYGADGPVAFDCSGLTQHVYERFGVSLPRTSEAQYQAVDHVPKSDLRLGDLVFYYSSDGIYHVGIYAGDKQIWAAGSPGEVVRKHHIWTDRFVVGRP